MKTIVVFCLVFMATTNLLATMDAITQPFMIIPDASNNLNSSKIHNDDFPLTDNTEPKLQGADLGIAITDYPDPVFVNQELTYMLLALNNGPDDATGVYVWFEYFPVFSSFISVPTNCNMRVIGLVNCNIGNLMAGDDVEFTIIVTSSDAGSIMTNAHIFAHEPDPNHSNNVDEEITTAIDHLDIYLPLVKR